MIFYKRFLAAFRKNTSSLTLAEVGAYDRLLDNHYETERPLPLVEAELYRIAGAFTKDEQQAVLRVVARFFVETPAGWMQERAGKEMADAKAISAMRAGLAHLSWKGRGPRRTTANPQPLHKQLQSNSTAIAGAKAMPVIIEEKDLSSLPSSQYPRASAPAPAPRGAGGALRPPTCCDCTQPGTRVFGNAHYCQEHYDHHIRFLQRTGA